MSDPRLDPPLSATGYAVRAPLATWLAAEASRASEDLGPYRLLDVGCGEMPYRPIFASHATEIVGLDSVENPLATLTGPITCQASLFPSISVDNPRYCSYSNEDRAVISMAYRISQPLHYTTDTQQCASRQGELPCAMCLNASRLVMQAFEPMIVTSIVERMQSEFNVACPFPHPSDD